MDNITYQPISVGLPGDIVIEYLESFSWTQKDLANRTGISTKTISEVCNGKAKINASNALAFEKVLGRPAHFWLNLQRRYDEAQERLREREHVEEWKEWAKKFPLKEMKKRGWLSPNQNTDTSALLHFLGVSSPERWAHVWSSTHVAYRQTRKFKIDDYSISAWLRAAELLGLEKTTSDFDEAALWDTLSRLRSCTRMPIDSGLTCASDLLGKVGIAFVIVPALPHTGISGCTKWIGKKKVIIAISLRYKFDDQIWFTIFHEIGHVLLHRKRFPVILDNAADDLSDQVIDPDMQKIEEEANRFAADTLIPADYFTKFLSFNLFESKHIQQFAEAIDVAPGIVIGRLQKEGIIEPHMGNKLKQRANWEYGPSEE